MARLRARLSSANVSSSKVKNGSLTKSDFKASDLPVGLAGPQGAQGSQGLQGSGIGPEVCVDAPAP